QAQVPALDDLADAELEDERALAVAAVAELRPAADRAGGVHHEAPAVAGGLAGTELQVFDEEFARLVELDAVVAPRPDEGGRHDEGQQQPGEVVSYMHDLRFDADGGNRLCR